MAAIPFVGTIESDEEVEQFDREGESDDEEETPVKKKKKKRDKSMFSESFQFADGEKFSENTWNLDTAMRSAKQKDDSRVQTSSLQEKITKRREQKKKSKRKKASSEHQEQQTEPPNIPAAEADRGDSSSDSSSEDEADDKVKQKKKFFEEPPPQMKCHSFTDMNLSRPLLKAVTELGFVHPTPIQAATIPVALMAKDICACAATGTGKTAAFMLPILERLLYRPHHTPVTRVLILSPTRELAIQTHSVSKAMTKFSNIQICLAAGGLDSKAQEVALRKGPDIVIATPGRLVDHLHNAHSFDLQSIEILVLDEADRMLDEHFKDQMDEIVRLSPRGRQTMLFSATMTDEVEELVNLSLNQPVRLFVDANTDVAYNLRQEFIRIRPNREDDRLAIVVALCCRTFTDHCLVFLQTKKLAHRLRIILGLMGLNVEELHGNLTQLQRLESLEKFKEAKVDILVATDLASRGLDISGVKTVINHSMPSTLKSYVHRVGRTARAGKSGRSVSLVGEQQRKLLKEIVKQARTPVKSRVIPPAVAATGSINIGPSTSTPKASFGRVSNFQDFVEYKTKSAKKGLGKMLKKWKYQQADKDQDVLIYIGLMEWAPLEALKLKRKYGKRVGLRVSRNAPYAVLLEKAVEKWKAYCSDCYEEDEPYVLLLANLKEAIFLPGQSKEFFSLNRYQEEVGKDFKSITLFLCTEKDFKFSEGIEIPLSSDEEADEEYQDKATCDSETPLQLKRKREVNDTDENTAKKPSTSSTAPIKGCGNDGIESQIQHDKELAEQIQMELDSEPDFEDTKEEKDLEICNTPTDVVRALEKRVTDKEQFFISIRRGTKLTRILSLWQHERKKRSPCNILRVKFLGEDGIDTGALAREFLTEAITSIGATLFPDGSPLDSTLHVQNGNFRASGEIVATSLAQQGPPPCFLDDCTFQTLVKPEVDLLKLNPEQDLTGGEQQLLQRIKNDIDQHRDIVMEHGYTGRINEEHIDDMIGSLTVSLVNKRVLYLKEFREGLRLYGLSEILAKSPQACKPLFVTGQQEKVDAAYLYSLMYPAFSEERSSRRKLEEDVMDSFQDFLIELEEGKVAPVAYHNEDDESEDKHPMEMFRMLDLSPAGVLGWLTGQKHRQLNEDKIKIVVKFDHECLVRKPGHSICFPLVAACGREITFPVMHMKEYDEFKNIFQLAFCRGQAFAKP